MCQQLYYKILRPNLLGHNYTYKQCTDLAKAKSKGSINTYNHMYNFNYWKQKKIPMKKLQQAYANPEIHTYSD